MENLKLNESPVRTSRNFNINNIKLKDISIPQKIGTFKNMQISGDLDSIDISEDIKNYTLTYGLGNTLLNMIKNDSNKKIKILISKNTLTNIDICFDFNKENYCLLDFIEITVEENINANISVKYESNDDSTCFHNGIIKIHAKPYSNININLLNMLNIKSNNFISIENIVENNANIQYNIVDFGGKNSITNYYSNLIGEESQNKIRTIYLGTENQLFDLNYIAELSGKKSNINIEVQGALKDLAKKNFKGTINFKKGCKKSTGNENETCMLLSNTAKSMALPILLCSEEEVEGTHSSSAGKIDEKELFYIMSRGFSRNDAMKLVIRAKFNTLLENINDNKIKERIIEEIEKRLV